MSDNPNPIQVPINFNVDTRRATPNVDELATRIRQLRADLTTLSGQAKAAPLSGIGTSAKVASAEVLRLRNILEDVNIDATVTQSTKNLTVALKSLRSEVTQTEKAIDNLNATPTRLTAGVSADAVGTFEQPLKGLAGGVGAFGGAGNVGSALNLGAEVSGSIEAIGRLSSSLTDLRREGGGATLALGAVGLGLAALAFVGKQSRDEATAYIRAQEEAIQRTKELRAELEQLSSVQDIERTKRANEIRRQEIEQQIADLERERDASFNAKATSLAESALTPILTLGAGVGDTLGKTADVLKLVGITTEDYDNQLAALNEELKTLDASTEQLNSSLAEISVQAKEAANAIAGEVSLARERNQLLLQGTTDDLDKRRQAVEIDLQATTEALTNSRERLKELLIEQVKSVTGMSSGEIAELAQGLPITEQLKALQDVLFQAGVELAPGLDDLAAGIFHLEENADQFTKQLELYNNPLLQAAIKAREAETKALADNKKALEDAEKAEKERFQALGKATKGYQSAVAELETFQATLADKARERQQEAERELVREDYRRQIAAAKEAEAEAERIQKVNAARLKANDEIQEVERKAQAESLKAARRYQKDRLDAENDLRDGLADAALNNDVNAFIAAKKAGDKELDRIEDEHREQETERQNQARETTQNIIRQLREQERAELTQRGQAITRSMQLEQQLARIEEQWRVQDAQRRFQLEQQASNQRLQLLQNEVVQARNIIRLLQQPNLIRPAVNTAVNTISNVIGSVGNLIRFADGGIVTRPTLALLGEGKTPEAILPFRPSEGIGRAAKRAGLGATYQVTVNVGELATPEDIRAVKAEVYGAILQADMAILKEVV